jgi:hypothetical protein
MVILFVSILISFDGRDVVRYQKVKKSILRKLQDFTRGKGGFNLE